MFCPNCGKPTSEGAAFCANCGTPLSASIQPTVDHDFEEAIVAVSAAADEVLTGSAAVNDAPEAAAPLDESAPIEANAPMEEPTPAYVPPMPPLFTSTQPADAVPVAAPVVGTRPKSSVAAKIFSVLLCFFLVLDLFSMLVCLSLRQSISTRTIKQTLENVDILDFPYDGENTVLDLIAEQYEEMGEDISADDIREALDSSKAYDELKEIAVDMAGYALGDANSDLPDADSLRELVEDLCDDLDYEITASELDEIDMMLEDFEDSIEEFKDATSENIPELDLIQAVVSTVVVGIFGAIAVLILLLILAMNRRRYATLCYAGVSTVLSGGLCFAVGMLFDLLIQAMGSTDASAEYMINAVSGMLTGSFTLVGLAGVGVGVVLIVAYAICCHFSKKKYSV